MCDRTGDIIKSAKDAITGKKFLVKQRIVDYLKIATGLSAKTFKDAAMADNGDDVQTLPSTLVQYWESNNVTTDQIAVYINTGVVILPERQQVQLPQPPIPLPQLQVYQQEAHIQSAAVVQHVPLQPARPVNIRVREDPLAIDQQLQPKRRRKSILLHPLPDELPTGTIVIEEILNVSWPNARKQQMQDDLKQFLLDPRKKRAKHPVEYCCSEHRLTSAQDVITTATKQCFVTKRNHIHLCQTCYLSRAVCQICESD